MNTESTYPDCDATLTRAEREAPFAVAAPDPEPLPEQLRVLLVWDGPRWAEVDAATGQVLASGEVRR